MEELLQLYWIMMFAGLGLIIMELFIGIDTGFDLVLIGSTLIIGGGVGKFSDNPILGVIITGILAVLYIIYRRNYLKSKLTVHTQSSNIDSLVGTKALVIKTITPHKAGQIKVGGETWRAVSDKECIENTYIMIIKIEGVTAYVDTPVV
ncbi:hypothetical protein CO180_00660 [candidate division WWE3 bacterium CG_4_9_14_3_um_filter_41_6]|uniref:NfeD-like C-terminal domain-containing protein n=1 Tax=candidate division WWE3 bacterium CG_4_10_14_0_2_um_filter_41_14 TaxID=1975072 RepID=A0A2M7THP2_UNCKA|nr:MAG: hypothetical protein COY32_05370 [candidate division WWE3 bacterium CG_4_10_14_0_2_um_filter_41_14]PJA39480.1 MAG: hypothetical protein CO180_00660 [candidate division WWE3 bacterium CG_4_9_14_3_um_filter_41_6]